MKKIVAVVICLLLAMPAFGGTKKMYHIVSFDKGLNSHISEWALKDNQASEARDVRFNQRYGAVSKRSPMYSYGTVASSAVEGLHRLYTSDDTKKLIAAAGTKLYVGDDVSGSFDDIETGLSDGAKWQFLTYQDIAIGVNGVDQPIKYDGKTLKTADTDAARTDDNMVSELGAPFAELQTGTDLDASKWYQYKVAFYDGTNYYYSTAKSNAIQTGSSVYNVTLTDIPLGPSGTTERYVYRTEGAADKATVEADTSYYLAQTINDNTTITVEDDTTDTALTADDAPTWSTVSAGTDVTPPVAKYCHIHDERLFLAGNSTEPSDLYWSEIYLPDFFNPADYLQVRPDDGDDITFIKTLLGILTIGKQNTIQKLYTRGSTDNWTLTDPYSFEGCPAPYSVVTTPVGLMYLGRKGIYSFNGQQVKLMSDAVTPETEDVLSSNIESVTSVFWKNEYLMSYTSEESGATTNNRVLAYDVIRDAYAIDYKNVSSWAVLSSGDDYGVLYSGSSDTDSTVYAHQFTPNDLRVRNKSSLNEGTFDDARATGEEEDPEVEIAWSDTIDDVGTTIDNTSGIIDRPDTDGDWESPVYEVNAQSFDKLYWNEDLGGTGDVTIKIATGNSVGAMGSFTGSYSDPTGTDISGISPADYVQIKAELSTTNIQNTPLLQLRDGYVTKMVYSKAGNTKESDFLSIWAGGWEDMKSPGLPKHIKRIRVFYSGDTGTISVNFKNAQGDFDTSFDIDLSQDPYYETDMGDEYKGSGDNKLFTYYTASNAEGNAPVGEFWKFTLSNTGTETWNVNRIEVLYEISDIIR